MAYIYNVVHITEFVITWSAEDMNNCSLEMVGMKFLMGANSNFDPVPLRSYISPTTNNIEGTSSVFLKRYVELKNNQPLLFKF